ncbi:MAG: hypothetical protein U1F33_04100 [Alphaproteobacteria bacterium]
MDKLARGERNRSIRMLLAGGSALATVMVLGTQAANALVATPEELAALNGSSVNTVADGAARTPVAADCGDVAQADGWAAGRYHDLAAVGSADTKGEEEAAPQPSYRQLTLLGEPMSPTTLATAHAAAVGVPSAGEPDPVTETPRAQRVREFEELAAVDSAELDNMRGGFDVGGMTVRFGFELVNMLNGVIVDKFTMPLTNVGTDPIAITHLSNVQGGTQQTQTTEILTQLPKGALVDRTFNNGQTRMAFSINSSGVMSLVQNGANSQNIQSLANINLNVSGLTSQLRNLVMNVRAMDALRSGRFHR